MSEYVIKTQLHDLLSQISIYITKDKNNADKRLCVGISAKLILISLILSFKSLVLISILPILIIPLIYILNQKNLMYKKEINPHINRLNYLLAASIKDFKYIESELTFLLECQKACVLVSLSIQIIRWISAIGIIASMLFAIYC